MQIICGGLHFISYHSATGHTSETNLKNVPTLDFKKFCIFSLHLFDSLIEAGVAVQFSKPMRFLEGLGPTLTAASCHYI